MKKEQHDAGARLIELQAKYEAGAELNPEEWALLLSDGRPAEPSTFGWAALLLQTIAQAPNGAAAVGVLAAALTSAIELDLPFVMQEVTVQVPESAPEDEGDRHL